MPISISIQGLNAYYGKFRAVKNITLDIKAKQVTSVIGPSGCGKSTMLRCLNRMHEETQNGRTDGKVLLDDEDIYDKRVDPVAVRRKIGMVFQKPNPFPTMSVFDNVVAGFKLNRFWVNKSELADRVELALKQASLWDEVKDKLNQSGMALSGGQQQRLCIARTLAVEPEVVLMDEPCSALDPVATLKIEDLIRQLTSKYTIVIVTHNMQQAARVSDWTTFLLMGDDRAGELIEYGETKQLFTNPKDERTEAYITGRFG
ncbi:MAG: phosphate ABC transporter ATP-binding protein [Dehalococcoidia bacterium]|nr:phosphate ABC transporter ATP-binding protein [Dehalococcoidia bacterium]